MTWSSTRDRPGLSHTAHQFVASLFSADIGEQWLNSMHRLACVGLLPSAAGIGNENPMAHDLTFRVCGGVFTVDTAGRTVAARLCPLPIPLGDRHHDETCTSIKED